MTCICSWYNARSVELLVLSNHFPVMSTDWLRARKGKVKSHIINNLLTSNVRAFRENLKSVKTYLPVNKLINDDDDDN